MIGPKDIKRGLHLLTNANMAVLEAPGPAAPDLEDSPGEEPDLERQSKAATEREERLQGELLSGDQVNQVCDKVGQLMQVLVLSLT